MDKRFLGRVAAVTGGGSGIGAGIARRLADEGATVAILDLNLDGAAAVADEIRATGGAALAIGTDVSRPTSVAGAFAEIDDKCGELDVLVNDAGITKPESFPQMTESQWRSVLAVNLSGTFYCARTAALRFGKRRSGRIVNISSLAVLAGPFGRVNYTASKAGVVGLTRALALEFGPLGITVNAVAPGFVDTPMTTRAQTPERRRQVLEMTPLRRLGRPEDIAAAVAFFASDDASFVTGQCLFVCGGRSIIGTVP